MTDATSFRVVNAEADLLSGLIVDKYERHRRYPNLSARNGSAQREIVAAVQRYFRRARSSSGATWPRGSSRTARGERRDRGRDRRESESEPERPGLRNGPDRRAQDRIVSGPATELPPVRRVFLRRVPGANVLDCFSFLGGFACTPRAPVLRRSRGSTKALKLWRRRGATPPRTAWLRSVRSQKPMSSIG